MKQSGELVRDFAGRNDEHGRTQQRILPVRNYGGTGVGLFPVDHQLILVRRPVRVHDANGDTAAHHAAALPGSGLPVPRGEADSCVGCGQYAVGAVVTAGGGLGIQVGTHEYVGSARDQFHQPKLVPDLVDLDAETVGFQQVGKPGPLFAVGRTSGKSVHASVGSGSEAKMRKISTASVVGTTVEWYDLFLFGTASALVFNKIFFPELDGALGTILSFLTFASAYLARMVGAIVFGHFGDPVGRKSMLLISLIRMGLATFGIGLVSDFHAIGIGAPLLQLTLRLIQGLALGGEWGGAVLMTVEHSPENKRGFYGSMVQIGVPIGTLLANIAFLVVASNLDQASLLSWGWRVPFLLSALLVAVGIYIRLHIEETPSFQKVRDTVVSGVRYPRS